MLDWSFINKGSNCRISHFLFPMLRPIISPISAACVLAASFPAIMIHAQEPARAKEAETTLRQEKKPLPPAFESKLRQGDFDGISKLALSYIDKKNKESKNTAALLDDAAYCQCLAIAEVIRITSPEILSSFSKSSPKNQAFLKSFLGDTEWMELYLGAGLVPEKTPMGMQVLSDIWQEHGNKEEFRNFLSLACGLASTWGAGPTSERLQKNEGCDYMWRFNFYKTSQEKGKLHPDFPNLRPWEIRFIVGHWWQDRSFQWLQENLNIPWRRYTDACWFADYTGTNFFGDSIQGPLFYVPWREESGEGESTKLRGGVCGGLSTFGSNSANAHGLPSYTVGQPGHCAYAVRAKRGKWVGGFGGPDGGMHNHIFGHQAPTSYLLMEAVFADNGKIDKAYRFASQARAMEANQDTDSAILAWQDAIEQSPLHPHFRKELHRLLKQKGGMTAYDWLVYSKEALPLYQGNGFAAEEVLKDNEGEFITQISEKERNEWYKELHEVLATTPTSWAVPFTSVLDAQISNFETDQGKEDFLKNVLAINLSKGDGTNFGQTLEWAVKTFVEGDSPEVFSKAFAAASSGSKGSSQTDPKKVKEAYGKAIVATEIARSIPAFQSLSKAASQFIEKDTTQITFKSEPLAGRLAPPEGMIRCSTTCNWDNPADHLYVMMPCGGSFHTSEEKNPSVIVDLPGSINLSGLIISKTEGNQDRIKKVKVSTSTDGATWFPLKEIGNMQEEWRIEAPEGTKARHIKIEAENDTPQFFHLRHILVYQR